MPKHLYLIFIATFIFGMISGGVLFLYNNTGGEGDGGIARPSSTSVTVETYGGCERRGCATYHIEEKGDYTYIIHSVDGKESRYEGSLTSTQRKALLAKIADTEFQVVTNSKSTERCSASVDRLAYRYTVVYKDTQYAFDSCEENTGTVPLFEALNEYFEIFNLTHGAL